MAASMLSSLFSDTTVKGSTFSRMHLKIVRHPHVEEHEFATNGKHCTYYNFILEISKLEIISNYYKK